MSLEDFMAGEKGKATSKPGRKCSICSNPALFCEVEKYVAGVQDGTIQHTQHYIWLNYFAPTWGVGSQNTLRNHIKICLATEL